MSNIEKNKFAKTHYGIRKSDVLVIRFTDQSKPFFHGFEAGKIWAMLLEPQEADTTLDLEFDVSPENVDLVHEMAAELDFSSTLLEAGDAQRYARIKVTRYIGKDEPADEYTTH